MGGHVPGVHALPWAREPGGDAAGDERRSSGTSKLLSGSGLRPDVPMLASDSRRKTEFQNNTGASRLLHPGEN